MSSCRTPPFVPPHYHHHQDDPQRHRSISFPITMIQCSSLCCFSLLINITIGVPKDNPMLVLVGRLLPRTTASWVPLILGSTPPTLSSSLSSMSSSSSLSSTSWPSSTSWLQLSSSSWQWEWICHHYCLAITASFCWAPAPYDFT